MKRLLEEEMDKKRARNFIKAGIYTQESCNCEEAGCGSNRMDSNGCEFVRHDVTEPKTYGDKYKTLFDRGREIKQAQGA